MEKFKINNKPAHNFHESNKWFIECEKVLQPFVFIQKKSKFYYLKWDFIAMTGQDINTGIMYEMKRHKCNDKFFKDLDCFFLKYWTLKRKPYFKSPVDHIPKMTLENAIKAAEEIFDILMLEKIEYLEK